ncbi:MAG: stress response translation initiation inhibitor YciH [Candidatus Riflebacteria bacterium]|nr:stress response translation initiation inhibitor YciH [Candidatus Riflebacteria bacterium]
MVCASSGDSRLVYTSDDGRICAECSFPVKDCKCRKDRKGGGNSSPETASNSGRRSVSGTGDGVVRLRREMKGRGGKTVTTISGVSGGEAVLDDLAKKLKKRCGTGGTVKDGVIEIQGDHRDVISAELQKAGYTVKLAGG